MVGLAVGVSAGPPTWLQEKYVLVPVFEFPNDAVDLLRELLKMDPDERLGGALRPARPFLRRHPFFAGVDWVCVVCVFVCVCARVCPARVCSALDPGPVQVQSRRCL